MTIERFFLEYTIENVCHGNRSECARRMGMEYAEMRKFRKRISEGGSSNRIMEALLEMYWREKLSVDEVLRRYTAEHLQSEGRMPEEACASLLLSMKNMVSTQNIHSQGIGAIMRAAYEMGQVIEKNFCRDVCVRAGHDSDECALRRFAMYMESLKNEIDESQRKMTRE